MAIETRQQRVEREIKAILDEPITAAELIRAVMQATDDEQERCAKICDLEAATNRSNPGAATAEFLASEIRRQAEPEE